MNYKNSIKCEKLVLTTQYGLCILFSICCVIILDLSTVHAYISTKSNFKIGQSLEIFQEINEDYIIPIKVNDLSINDEDLSYESVRKKNFHINNYKNERIPVYNFTSTYRHKSNKIWDLQPEYIINAFERQLHLVLHQDSSFIPSKTFRVTKILDNNNEVHIPGERTFFGCYYNGYVKGDEQSAVAVSLCHGITGYIKTYFGSLLIQPIKESTEVETLNNPFTTSKILHKIWWHSRLNTKIPTVSTFNIDSNKIHQNYMATLKRMKRDDQPKSLTVELLIAVDNTMEDYHKKNLESYIMTLISVASKLFNDPSLGRPLRISVADIIVLSPNKRLLKLKSSSQTLNEFCTQIQRSGYHYDAAMFLTRRSICGGNCSELGLAYVGTICESSACFVVNDHGLATSFTIAHELGHILNMPHDDSEKCKPFTKPNESGHIMFSTTTEDTWSWSDCSRHYISEYLEQHYTCLLDTPTRIKRNNITRLPGEIYSLNKQCELLHGNKSVSVCKTETECKKLWCKTTDSIHTCVSHKDPWADGTPCNTKKTNRLYWCQSGECLPRARPEQQVVNGAWSSWGPWSACSRTCGGGVQQSARDCNNPVPKSGGKYCTGSRKKYRSCNTKNCPPGSMDFRKQQCFDMNGRDFRGVGIGPHTKWLPKYDVSPKYQCSLNCLAEGTYKYYRLAAKVLDGTKCSLDSFDQCVNGVCLPAGCDNELNSIAKLDKCGICEGHNDTCQEHGGKFYVKDLRKLYRSSSYYPVTVIPKGAFNILIKQIGFPNDNFIVLKDDRGNTLLNGNYTVISNRITDIYAGVAYDYSGSDSFLERVKTKFGQKLKRDLIVEILSSYSNILRNKNTLLLTYNYTLGLGNVSNVETPRISEATDNLSNMFTHCLLIFIIIIMQY